MREYGWLDPAEISAAVKVSASAFVASTSADMAVHELEADAKYDAGFEAGVLAAEHGLGRYDG